MAKNPPAKLPPQHQEHQPGKQKAMEPQPITIREDYQGSAKLHGQVALITGGDSGIGRAVAVHFAREGADIAILYLEEHAEHADAQDTRRLVEQEGRQCLLIEGDVGDEDTCVRAVNETLARFGRLDVLVNNAGQQLRREELAEIQPGELERIFRTNVFGYLFMAKAAVPHMRAGSSIVNTGSITGARGNEKLVDYSASKGAIQALTFSLAQALADKGIRVNGVAPGPVWTPLIPATFPPEAVEQFGHDTLLGRPGQPSEIAPAYVFLASADASFMTGQMLHINGGSRLGA
jgi:NAD(P)-dependent dehydrogenase (short-subunit alcohol dehydrogenase family)